MRRSWYPKLPDPLRTVNVSLFRSAPKAARNRFRSADPAPELRVPYRDASRREEVGEVPGRRRDELERRASARMAQPQRQRMQRLALEWRRHELTAPIERIAQAGMADRSQVDRESDECGRSAVALRPASRRRPPPASAQVHRPRSRPRGRCVNSPTSACARPDAVRPDARSKSARVQPVRAPPLNRFAYRAFLELTRQLHPRKRRPRDHHHARRVLVESMDDSRTHHAVRLGHRGHLRKERKQRVDQRPPRDAQALDAPSCQPAC